ncbi:unnamed protein product [Symbiodinium sp. CCMP2592]|nr:unnamed protein product [Symbiodinium sp. CCMP2592]
MSVEEELPQSGLSYVWFKLEGLSERGAGGRLVVAPATLTRQDLDFNWDIIARAMEYMGARPGVDQLQDEVDLFFQRSRQKGKKPVTRDFCRQQAWRVRNLISMFNRIVKLPHRPNEEGIRKIYTHLGLEIPPGTLPANDLADMISKVVYHLPKNFRLGRQPRSNDALDAGSEEARWFASVVQERFWVMRQVGYDECVESEAGTDDELMEPEPLVPEAPEKNNSPPEPPKSRSTSSGTLASAPSVEDLVTPKHEAGPGKSPESGEKLAAPSKRELLKALNEQQHHLSLLLMAKKRRAEGKPAGGILHAASNISTQETQVMDEAWMDAAAAGLYHDIKAKELAAVAANVYAEETPRRFGDKRLRTETAEMLPASKSPKSEPALKLKPVKKEPLEKAPVPSIEKEPLKPLQEPPIKKERFEGTPIKKEPFEETPVKKEPPIREEPPIKKEPGIKHEFEDEGDQKAGLAPVAEAEAGHDLAAAVPPEPKDPPAVETTAAMKAASPERPALVKTSGVVSPTEQNKLTKKKKKEDKNPTEEEAAESKKTRPKPKTKATQDAKKTEEAAVPKRKPGRPRKNPPEAESKPEPAKPKKETPKKRKAADDEPNSQDTRFYSPKVTKPNPKSKAKAKAKAKAKGKAAAKAAKDAGDKKTKGAAQDSGLKSRKSCAYHKAKATAMKEGLSKEEAVVRAKKATWLNRLAALVSGNRKRDKESER